MKKTLLFSVIMLFFTAAFAQNKEDLSPCGTQPLSQKELNEISAINRFGGDTVLYVPLTIHNLANEGTASFFSMGRILDAFDRLNKDYAPSKMQFYMEGAVLNKRNTSWNNHTNEIDGGKMMFANNVKNTINIYICSNAAGNCGYNLPYAGIALSKGCMGANDHTWAHELGHGLTLQHTFLGWEAKKYNPNLPTPKWVTYDYTLFKDSLILGQTIIDTAIVELVDGSNCAIAADNICDTKPDYISERWVCGANKLSAATYKDPDGKTFNVDGTPYMSYSNDACQNRFTEQEITRMRSVLLGKKNFLLYNQIPKPIVDSKASLLNLPLNNSKISPKSVVFQWDKVQNAEQYVLQVSRSASFSFIEFELITDKTELIFDLDELRNYYVRVRAFNSYYADTPWSLAVNFSTIEFTAVNDALAFDSFAVFPNPLSANELLQIVANSKDNAKGEISIKSLEGRVLFSQKINLLQGENRFSVAAFLPKGIYILTLQSEKGRVVRKILVD